MTFPEKIVRPGSYVSLVCVASGNPAPQMKWLLDGIWTVSTRPGALVSTYMGTTGDVISYLNFTSVDVSDSGLYRCEAVNEAGVSMHSKRLNVFGPLFIRPISNLTALAGTRFSVNCPFGGFPFDTISWKRGKKSKFYNNLHTYISSSFNSEELILLPYITKYYLVRNIYTNYY